MNKPRWREMMEDPAMPAQMRQQLRTMAGRAVLWKDAHPQAELLVEWPDLPGGTIIGCIDEVIEGGAIKVNQQAIDFFKALWPWHDTLTPTLSMCRYVMEEVYGPKTSPTNS